MLCPAAAMREHDGSPTATEDHQRREQRARQESKKRTAPSGAVIYPAILREARDELRRPSMGLFWSGAAAGLSLAASVIAEALLRAHLPDAGWRPLVAKFGYSFGFLIVILGRQQLFTENTLTPVLPLLQERSRGVLRNVLRMWGVVLGANLLGALIMAVVLTQTPLLDPAVRSEVIDIGRDALQHGAGGTIVRGIFAGWLIAMMVWVLPFAETARVSVIVLLTWLVGIGQFAHCIAGAVQVFACAAGGGTSWGNAVFGYVLPALLGNIIGGVTLVAAVNHAQVNPEEDAGA
jgi:formate/nitrite transporter FocA (FNT family)